MHLCCRLRFLRVSGVISYYEHRFFDVDCASAGEKFLPSITILSMSTKWLISLKESCEKNGDMKLSYCDLLSDFLVLLVQ